MRWVFNIVLSSAAAAAAALAPFAAMADDESCPKGEWVFTISPSAALTNQALEAIDEVSSSPIAVADDDSHAMLIKETRGWSGRNLCSSLDKRARRNRANGDRIGSKVRRYSCTCNSTLKMSVSPNDPMYSYEWGLHVAQGVDMQMEGAWNVSTGNASTIVAIIDTGIQYTHPDLSANVWTNPNEIPGNGIDDDGNGYVDDVHGFNMVNNTGDPMDDAGHGTHVAGTIGGIGNNGVGVTGVNWRVSMIGVKFLDSNGSGSTYNAIRAVDYVTALKNKGVPIILSSNSWGGGSYAQPLYDAIARARTANMLFVAAAGNNGYNTDNTPSYPAGYDLDNIISVAAIDSSGALAYFSNRGKRTVDIAAPGVNIASTYLGSTYQWLNGTSMATPHVSGALALLYSAAPYMSWSALRDSLYQWGTPLGSLTDQVATGKTVNAFNMLTHLPTAPAPTATPIPTSTPTPPPPTTTPTPVPTATPTPTPAPGYYIISGTLTVGGLKLPGARVSVTSSGGTQVVVSNSNGYFAFAPIFGPTGYTVSADLEGYAFSPSTGYLVRDTSLSLVGSSLTYSLTGTAMDNDKHPLAGVAISGGVLGDRTTDSQGRFSFTVPYGTTYHLVPSKQYVEFSRAELSGVITGDVDRTLVGSAR